jgi:hypothetical protein
MGAIYRAWLESLFVIPSSAATTILVAVTDCKGRTILSQLGDGLVLYRSNGSFGILTHERAGFADQTNALGLSRSWADWQSESITLQIPGKVLLEIAQGICTQKLQAWQAVDFDRTRALADAWPQ